MSPTHQEFAKESLSQSYSKGLSSGRPSPFASPISLSQVHQDFAKESIETCADNFDLVIQCVSSSFSFLPWHQYAPETSGTFGGGLFVGWAHSFILAAQDFIILFSYSSLNLPLLTHLRRENAFIREAFIPVTVRNLAQQAWPPYVGVGD